MFSLCYSLLAYCGTCEDVVGVGQEMYSSEKSAYKLFFWTYGRIEDPYVLGEQT